MSGKIQITGGLYQNFEGAPLANGYLIVQLSHDGQETVDPGLINGYPKIQINLDSNGNIPVSPATMIWPNDQILPSGTFYTVSGYAADGTLVFGPQTWSLTSGTSPYNIANIVPSNPPGSGLGGASVTGPLLETNGTANTNQALLNLAGSGSITVSNSAGTTTISGGSGTFATSGQGWFAGPGMTDASSILMNSATSHIINYAAHTVLVFQFVLQSSWTLTKVAYQLTATGAGGSTFNFGIYSAAKNLLIDSTAFDATSSAVQTKTFTATVLAPGTYYFACTSTDSNAHGPCAQVGSVPVQLFGMMNATVPLFATAANAESGGALPATLGTLTGASGGTVDSLPLPIWKV